jgi:hypothetical protein
MPYAIAATHIRTVNPRDDEQLRALAVRLNSVEYFLQSPPYTLPKTIEPEFAQRAYLTWAYDTILTKYPSSRFTYAVVDHTFVPFSRCGRTLTVPNSFISMFDYGGATFVGPLFLGITPCILQANGAGHPAVRQNMYPVSLTEHFTAQDQQRLAQQTVTALLDYPGIAGVIVAIPNSRAWRGSRTNDNAPALTKAAYFHLLIGGQTLDQYVPDEFAVADCSLAENRRRFYLPNPLRSAPMSFSKLVRSDADAYTVFPLLNGRERELLNDIRFCQLCHDVRSLGPDYQRCHSERGPGIHGTVQQGLELLAELARLGMPQRDIQQPCAARSLMEVAARQQGLLAREAVEQGV